MENDDTSNQRNMPVEDFDGLSAYEMEQLLYHPFEGDTIIKFAQKAENGVFSESPAFLIASELLKLMAQGEGIKLTSEGYLTPGLVKSLYNKHFSTDEEIERGGIEIHSEYDWMLLYVVRQLLLISELADRSGNMLTLSRKGSELLAEKSDYRIYLELLKAFCLGFSWASNDGFESEEIAQAGFMYVLYLLKKYGGSPRGMSFYSEKYFQAFPMLYEADDDAEMDLDHETLLEDEPEPDDEPEEEEDRLYCFELRFFGRFCRWFGLAVIEEDIAAPGGDSGPDTAESVGEVKRSKLFERIII